MANHNNVTGSSVHTPYRQVFADAAARAADAGPYTAADVNKKALQVDDNTEYRLSNHSPITWTPVGGGGGAGDMQGAYDGGGAVALDVDGGNDMAWDSATPDAAGLGLLKIRRNTTGAEGTVFKAPDQLDDSAQDGTALIELAGKGSDQTVAGTSNTGTPGGAAVLGHWGTTLGGVGGAGADALGASPAGDGGDGGGLQTGGAAGGPGGAADGSTQGGAGGMGGPADVLGGMGGPGAAANASVAANNGGSGSQGTFGGGQGGPGGNGSAAQPAGDGGFGAPGVFRGGHGGPAGGPAGGGTGNGGIAGDGIFKGGNAGVGTGGGSDGTAGDAVLDAGDPGTGTPGKVRIAESDADGVLSGDGSTPWLHNGRRVIGLGIVGAIQTVADVLTTIGEFQTSVDDRNFIVRGEVISRRADGEGKAWVFSVLARRGTGAASLTVDSLVVMNGPQESSALPWVISADDDGAGAIRIRFKSNEATTIDTSVEARVQEI